MFERKNELKKRGVDNFDPEFQPPLGLVYQEPNPLCFDFLMQFIAVDRQLLKLLPGF